VCFVTNFMWSGWLVQLDRLSN